MKEDIEVNKQVETAGCCENIPTLHLRFVSEVKAELFKKYMESEEFRESFKAFMSKYIEV